MTNHTNCLHPATPAGRAACRKAGSVRLFHNELVAKTIASAPCEACFWNAQGSAAQNIEDDKPHTWGEDLDADAIRLAEEAIAARTYLYDQGALSACSDHAHLV